MQAKVSRSRSMESQEVVGRGMDVVNTTREEVIRLESDRLASLSNPSRDAVPHPNAYPPPLASIETTIGRKITQALSQATRPEAVLSEVAALLGETYGVQACVISIPSAGSEKSLTAWFSKSYLSGNQQKEFLSNYTLIETETLTHSELFISDLTLSEIAYVSKVLPIRAVMSLPTQFQGQTNGVVSLMCAQSRRWTDLEIDTLMHIVDHVAIAISQISLQQKVAKQAQYQALIRKVTMAIQNSLEVPQVQVMALEGLAESLEIEQAFVLRSKFWDPRQSVRSDGDRIPKARIMVDSEWRRDPAEPESPLSQSFWVSDCGVCQVAVRSTAKSFVFGASTEFPSETIAPIFDPEKMPALMLVPLESKNRLLGFIAVQQSRSRHWQPEEIELVELLSAQISAAIIQTETLRQVESLVEERTAQLQQSLELQAKLYEITRKQIEKLREMNQRMDEFLSTLSHELRTPLTSMMLAIRMLRQANLSPDRRQQYLNILEQQCAQETSLINDLLALQELETKQVAFQLQKVDLRQAIDDVSQSFHQRWVSKGLTLDVKLPQRLPVFNTDRDSFNRILLELLTNAGKYADPNSTVRLRVTVEPGQQIKLALSNIGSAISEEELPHIFEKFRRCQGMTQNAVPGTGLGLALVKSLVQHLNGAIEATSVATADPQSYETCFTVTLPQNLEIAGA
ncbi:sensor histidine kinase [Leptolyngbya sp. NIES-2104]|uniref:sensor histidine kinase n=1 Tax=Leptolyngbya sp. NIES-2104 TaxID=1552121 RepID=UPI0006ECA68E|nr:GAF domain-containing protein [Leptolyngbya sp. NIES-2104]GAP98515.1 two-component sensor histidine kinase [Leptolyngbya sp. NIES-2104]